MQEVKPAKDAKHGMVRDTDILNKKVSRQDWVIINKRWNRAIKLGIIKLVDVEKSREVKRSRKKNKK